MLFRSTNWVLPLSIREYNLRWYHDNSSLWMSCLFLGGFMEEIILFLISYILVFLMYQLFIVSRAKKSKSKKEPLEVLYLKKMYKNLDFKKIPYNQLLQLIALISSFDISLIVSIVVNINNFILEIIVGFIGIILLILVSYHLIYLFYKKKGMIKND